MNKISEKSLKRSRIMYILEAAFEHLIQILISGSFLATLTKELGVSDGLTGVLSSIISLGLLFQLISISIRKTAVKRLVTVLSIINQILFTLLYVIPLISFPKQVKIAIFIVFIFSAYLIYNIACPKKLNWLMSLVDSKKRGSFTANKEMISLVSGMIFSFGMGALIDYFSEIGKIRIAFAISAIVIFVLMVLHSLSMIFTVEKPANQNVQKDLRLAVTELIKNKNILHITVIILLYHVSAYIAIPFYGTYQICELGLSLKFVSVMSICGSVSRILFSRFWGNYADKKSFAVMIEKCFVFMGLCLICVIFAVPSVGKIMFILYYVLHGIAMGGINSALTNLVFENVPSEKSSDALAITHSVAGLAGFLTTLCVSPLVTYIQQNNNSIFGFQIYAQQFVSILSLVFIILAIIYTRFVFIKKIKRS